MMASTNSISEILEKTVKMHRSVWRDESEAFFPPLYSTFVPSAK